MSLITADPVEFLTVFNALEANPATANANGVFLVEPADFRVATESAVDNVYLDLDHAANPADALLQARGLADAIRATGVSVKTFPGWVETPDAVFPNNVFATIPGRLIVGSMRHPRRRLEAGRQDIRDYFADQLAYELIDLSAQDCVAELTGPLIIDRARNVGFCGMSERVDEAGLHAMHKAFDLDLTFRFDLKPNEYHTNVVLSVLSGRACVICPDAFADQAAAGAIVQAYSGQSVILDDTQKANFSANCISIGQSSLFLSERAAEHLGSRHRKALVDWGFELHATDLSELERAGGSLRCMVAEIY